jgi:myosin-5
LGNFKDLRDGTVEVEGSDGVKVISKSDIHRYDASHELDHDDMCSMNHLHEAPLLDNLRRRFFNDKIYTTTGDVLISVNPYKKIAGLYDNIATYLDLAEDGEVDRSATKPHVYKIANDALVEMLYGKQSLHENAAARNQSVVVSGESGAGKTEASKHVMNFLIAADRERKMESDRGADEVHLGDAIRKVLVESNVIFEAFGNSKTVRNDNSSRFGKYIKLQYSEDNQLISAYSETFLLEKSRLMNVGIGERNYHVFYQLLRGEKDPLLISKLKLRDPSEFKMLLDGNGVALTSDMDPLYGELRQALGTLGCSVQEIHYLWGVVAAILHMGNLTVSILGEGNAGDEAVNDDQAPLSTDIGHVRISSSTISLTELADLLGLAPEMFVSRLSTQRVKVGNRRSVTIKRLNMIDINNNIAALSKWMYSSTFAWLIKKINFAHCSVAPPNAIAKKFTGILDIFGFEILQSNSFEQLCINFTNERLQQQFNEYVFDREQNIYKAEGLEWDSIEYKDNQPVIDLIGKKPNGLLIILEQQGMLNRGGADEGALLSAFNSAHDQKHPAYVKSRFGTDGKFTVKHFAGDVTYIVTGFLEKNNDSLQEDLMELMVCSSNPFIQNAIVCTSTDTLGIEGEPGFVADIDPTKIVASAGNLSMNTRSEDPIKKPKSAGDRQSLTGGDPAGGKKMATSVTVSFQFRSQLDVLLLNLRSTSPHYIKCVKPNSDKVPGRFNAEMVTEQLRYSGALEVVRIRQEGFPISLSFAQFYEMFEKLGFRRGWKNSAVSTTPEAKEYTAALCGEYLKHKKEYQLGLTKVFLKSESYERMHLAINAFLAKKVRKFQALARQRIASVRYRTGRKGILYFQAWVRMYLARKRFKKVMQDLFEAREREQIRLAEERRLANMAYVQRVEGLFAAVTAGELATVRTLLNAHPEDYYLRDEKENDRSVLQAACVSGNLDLIRYLQPSRDDIFYKDAIGNNAVHHVMYSGKKSILSILRYFAIVNVADTDNLHDVVASLQQMGIEPRRASALPPVAPAPTNTRHASPAACVKEIRPLMPPPAPALVEEEAVVSTTTGATTVSSVPHSSGKDHGHTHGAGGSAELKSGWLSKRGESQTWRKRWVVLTTEALMYFRNNKDKVPRDTLSFTHQNDIAIQRTPDKATAIDVFINTQSLKKKRDRVSLMADTEQEMQAWMNLLKAAAGVQSQPLRAASSAHSASAGNKTNGVKPLLVLRPTWTSQLLKSVNNARETPLHILAHHDVSTASAHDDGLSEEDTLILATWMVGNIAPLNVFNGRGLTPLQVAVQSGHQSLATLLTKQGADPSKTMYGTSGTRSTYDLVQDVEFQRLLKAATHVFAQRENSFLSMPPRLRGFHYFSIVFYRGQTK